MKFESRIISVVSDELFWKHDDALPSLFKSPSHLYNLHIAITITKAFRRQNNSFLKIHDSNCDVNIFSSFHFDWNMDIDEETRALQQAERPELTWYTTCELGIAKHNCHIIENKGKMVKKAKLKNTQGFFYLLWAISISCHPLKQFLQSKIFFWSL